MADEASSPFAEWIGRVSQSEDLIAPRLVASYRAIFGDRLAQCGAGDAPLGLHWCLSPAIAAMDDLGADGHPALNRDMPPVPLPRRMWAGGSVQTLAPLRVGDVVRRTSRIVDIRHKQGRTGDLWFVSVDHAYSTVSGTAIRERQDIVYREAATPDAQVAPVPAPAANDPEDGDRWTLETPPTLLFRYSAITFNGHRIHYDHPYATCVEGYAGLVVHGPIQATLLLNRAAVGLGHAPARLTYRGVAAAIAGRPLRVAQDPAEPWRLRTEGPDGTVHMEATVES